MKEFRKYVSVFVEVTNEFNGGILYLFVLFAFACMAGKEANGYIICARNCAKDFYIYSFILFSK